MALMVAAASVVALIAAGVLRRRVVLKLALRDFARRPGQTGLLIAGLLVASLVLSASLVAGDATEEMFLDNVYRAWGPVDLVMGTLTGRSFEAEEAYRILGNPDIQSLTDGGAPRLYMPASVEAPERGSRANLVNLVGIEPDLDATLGTFSTPDGRSVADPGEGVFVNQRMARRLEVAPGDSLTVHVADFERRPTSVTLAVSEVVENRGKADFQLRPNVFVRLDRLQGVLASEVINQVVLSAVGPDRAPQRVDLLDTVAMRIANRAVPGEVLEREDFVYRIAGAKAQSVRSAREQSRFFESVLTALGAIVALTSVALIVNLFVMLGEERRSEVAMMRALGLRRGGLLLLGLTEGLLYAVGAAGLGAGIGAFLGRYLGGALVDLYGRLLTGLAVEFTRPEFDFRIETLLTAASAGFLVSVMSVALVSYRTSRMAVVSAIRGLPEEQSRRKSPPVMHGLGVAGGATALGIGGFAAPPEYAPLLYLAGGTFLIGALAALIARYTSRRLGATLGALVILGWGLYSYVYLPDFEGNPDLAFAVVTAAAVVVVVSAVVLLSANLAVLGRVGRLFGPRMGAVVRTAAAYPVGYRLRTALSMSMFAIVIYMIAAFAVWGGLASGDPAVQSGGFDVFARATVPVSELRAEGAEEVVGLHVTRYELGYRIDDTPELHFPIALYGVDAAMAQASEFRFVDKPAGLSDAAVWERLAASSDLVVLDAVANPPGGRAGRTLTLNTENGPRAFTIAGIIDAAWMEGMFVSKQAFAELYPNQAIDTAWLIKSAAGISPGESAASLEQAHPGFGLEATTVEELFEESASAQRTFVGLFQVLLRLGLVIGLSGLAIASARTVLERRHAVGVLRALGFRRSMVGAFLILETLLVALLGCAVGLGTGLAATYWLVAQQLPNFQFAADWAQVWGTLMMVFGAAIVFTILPALRAAALHPAEAVRYVE